MNRKEDFIIGYAPTRRNVFSVEDSLRLKAEILNKIKSFGYQVIDIDDINEEGLLLTEYDASKTIEKFKNKKVDCVFSPHCNFGTESAVATVAKETGKPFLLWGPRDEAPLPDGSRQRDTQCGLFATSKILARMGVNFTYILNCRLNDELFERGFNNFIRAANVVKTFKKIRIGQIGVRPGDFWTVICNEGELLEKFNIQIVPFNLDDVVSEAKKLIKNPDKDFKETLKFVRENLGVDISDEPLKNLVALKVIIKRISVERDIPAFAIQCWNSLQDMMGIFPCFANSLLFSEEIPVACETDIHGAVTSLIAQAATFDEKPVFFADLTIRHPEDDNIELLWHCGPFPYTLRKPGEKAVVSEHFVKGGGIFGACSWEIIGGDVSIVRFDGANGNYTLLAGHAVGAEGPKNKGTYLWVKVKDWSKWEERLIYGPYIHHVIGIHDKIAPVIYEATKYIDALKFDTIEPSEKEIDDWLMGRSNNI